MLKLKGEMITSVCQIDSQSSYTHTYIHILPTLPLTIKTEAGRLIFWNALRISREGKHVPLYMHLCIRLFMMLTGSHGSGTHIKNGRRVFLRTRIVY